MRRVVLISLIPAWAERGYLVIEQLSPGKDSSLVKKPAELLIRKQKDLPADSPEYEKLFFEALWARGNERNLGDHIELSFGKKLDKAKSLLAKVFTGSRSLRVGFKEARLVTFLPTIFAALFFGFSGVVYLTGNLASSAMIAIPMLLDGGWMYESTTKNKFSMEKPYNSEPEVQLLTNCSDNTELLIIACVYS